MGLFTEYTAGWFTLRLYLFVRWKIIKGSKPVTPTRNSSYTPQRVTGRCLWTLLQIVTFHNVLRKKPKDYVAKAFMQQVSRAPWMLFEDLGTGGHQLPSLDPSLSGSFPVW